MLALAATIIGSIITGYSAYKIHASRRGRGRKLRDMEVLRRLNVPPKKQVRVWGFLMTLGLVLLSPGLGFLLSYDQTSGEGGEAAYSNLRTSPSGSPVMAPPSEELDDTPRAFDEDGSNGRPVVFASSGGGGGGGSGKKPSSGGGKTTSTSSSIENVNITDETTGVVNDDEAGSHIGEVSTSNASDPKETPVIYKADPASDVPAIGEAREGPAMTNVATSGELMGEAGSQTRALNETEVPVSFNDTASVDGESKPSEVATGAEAAAPEDSKEDVIVEGAAEDGPVSDNYGLSAAKDAPELTRTESKTESATIDAAREKRTVPNASRHSAAESLNGSASAEVQRGSLVIEEGTLEERAPLDGSESSENGGEVEASSSSPSSHPGDSEVEEDLPEASRPRMAPDLAEVPNEPPNSTAMEDGAIGSISDEAEDPNPRIDEVKKLEFKFENEMEGNGTGNVTGEVNRSADPSSNLEGPLNGSDTGPGQNAFGRSLDFDTEFENFASPSQPGMGIDRNDTTSSVTIMEFERIDLESNLRGGLGLTPTSPFR